MTTFDDILGQPWAIEAIRSAYRIDRLPHGLIFAGPKGVGKATTAKALAALFLCEHPKDDKPCGKCPACVVFESGNHPDYHVITKEMVRLWDRTGESKATELSIMVVRNALIEPAAMKPAMSRGKVFIVEEADLMNTEAQNAALKTLEEPNGRTLIVLLAEQPLTLLPTIRSRCQIMTFAALDGQMVRRELEKRGIGPQDAADAAEFADGSLGLALRWIEDGVLPLARDLRQRLASVLAGRVPSDLPEWFKKASEAYAESQLKRDPLASKSQMTRNGMLLYLQLAAAAFRQRMRQSEDPEQLETLCAAVDATAAAEQYLDANVTVPLIFQQFVVRLDRLFAA